MYIDLHVQYRLLLSDFNKNFLILTDFPKIPKHEPRRNFVQWKPSFSMRTDRHDETNSRFSQFFEKRLKMTQFNISFNFTDNHRVTQPQKGYLAPHSSNQPVQSLATEVSVSTVRTAEQKSGQHVKT
jgi:hypothetical protein